MKGSREQDDTFRREEEKMGRLLKDPFLRPLLDDLCQWLARILEIDISSDNFTVPLQTGDDLCRLALAISKKAAEMDMKCPTLKYKAGAKPGSFQARCNIEAFLKWAKALGVRETCLFETVDMVELKYLRNVLICLLEISKLADVYGVEPPELVKLEKSTRIGWQDLIKLSMKRSSSGEVMSVADITSAVGAIQREVREADQLGERGLERPSSVVKRWKEFTKTSLKARGEAVSTDPSKILDESLEDAEFCSPDSTSEIVEEPRYPGRSVGDASMDEPVVETTQSPITDTALEVGDVSEAYLTAEEPQTETETNFQDITQERDSESSEIVLSLEEVSLPGEVVEELALDDQYLDITVEQNLVEAVHSQPDVYVAPQLTVTEQAKMEDEPVLEVEMGTDGEDRERVVDEVEVGNQGDDDKTNIQLKEVEESGAEEAPDFSKFSVTIGEMDNHSVSSTPTQIAILVQRSDSRMSSASGTPSLTGSANLAGYSKQGGPCDREDGYTNLAYEGDSSLESGGNVTTSQPHSTSQQPPSRGEPHETSEVESNGSGLAEVTWCFALCYPAVYANKDGSVLTQEQYGEMDWKRSVFLLLGIILTILGTATAVIIGVLGPDDGSGSDTTGKLPITIFFTLLAVALVCLIIGLSLISLWVVQHVKINNRKLAEYDSLPSYGSIR